MSRIKRERRIHPLVNIDNASALSEKFCIFDGNASCGAGPSFANFTEMPLREGRRRMLPSSCEETMKGDMYTWLMERRVDDASLEPYLFALILSSKAVSPHWALENMLGLTRHQLSRMLAKHFSADLDRYGGEQCCKILLHRMVRSPFTCHCCARQLTRQMDVVRADVPLYPGYAVGTNRQDESNDLFDLLMEHRVQDVEEAVWLARIISVCSLGENHLWQDMGLTGRDDVSYILNTYFTPLAQKNFMSMKWKKFFYKQLCDKDDIKVCKAPSCSVCSHYPDCFGPESADPNGILKEHHGNSHLL